MFGIRESRNQKETLEKSPQVCVELILCCWNSVSTYIRLIFSNSHRVAHRVQLNSPRAFVFMCSCCGLCDFPLLTFVGFVSEVEGILGGQWYHQPTGYKQCEISSSFISIWILISLEDDFSVTDTCRQVSSTVVVVCEKMKSKNSASPSVIWP